MNERIKDLAEKARSETYAHFDDETFDWDVWHTVFQHKFAELIVRECAGIAKHHVMNISTYADADFVDEQIKQHFGVEE